MNKTFLLLLSVLFTGCVHMRSMSTTSVPVERSKPIEAEGYRFMLLMINTDNRYINNLPRDLAAQCPNGRVEGILTKHEDIIYFPLLAHAVRVTASGFCVDAAAPVSAPPETMTEKAPGPEAPAPEAPGPEAPGPEAPGPEAPTEGVVPKEAPAEDGKP